MPMGPGPNPNTASATGPATMARLEHGPLETRRRPEGIRTAPEVVEERRTTPGRSARREELVRANGSIIFGETQDLSFFWHVPPAC